MVGHQLRIEAISEDSLVDGRQEEYHQEEEHFSNYNEQYRQPRYSDPFVDTGVAPAYPPQSRLAFAESSRRSSAPTLISRETLPHFASFDRDWWNGGYSQDGKAYTTRTPEDFHRETPPERWEVVDQRYPFEQDQAPLTHSHNPHSFAVTADEHSKEQNEISDKKKKKRMRLLEKEFGQDPAKAATAEIERRRRIMTDSVVGTINSKSQLVTSGPKKRATLRWAEGLLAAAAVGASVGVALLIHPKESPPPKNSLPLYAMYGLSSVTLVATLWVFVFHPCCAKSKGGSTPASYGGNMMIPILGQNQYTQINDDESGCLGCCGGGKKPKVQNGQQPVNLNLMVDPSFFNRMPQAQPPMTTKTRSKRRKKQKIETTSDSDDSDSVASSFDIPKDPETAFEGHLGDHMNERMDQMRKERLIRSGRRTLKQRSIFDVVFCLLWLGEAIWAIGFGERCSAGEFDGW